MKETAKKQIRVRLYRVQDFDLYLLYYDPDFNIQEAFRLVISAYANGQEPPVIEVGRLQDLPHGKPAHIAMSFSVYGEKEIKLLEDASVSWRNMNNFCKSLLRRSLTGLDHIYGLEDFEDPMNGKADVSVNGVKKKTGRKKKNPEERKEKQKAVPAPESPEKPMKKEEPPQKEEERPAEGRPNPFSLIRQLSDE